MEEENVEQEILLEPEYAIVSPVTSVNGKIGAVVLTTSDLENDSDYQTGTEVQTAINTAISGKQDVLTPGTGINISNDTISIDSTVVATQQNLANEVTNRENADNALQSQIDAISASSDVVDIVGTYAELQAYDTQHLKDNDIIKVLQDETHNNATTYYRWSTTTQTFTLIGQEGPYYTKAAADAQFVPQTRTVNGKALSSNITLNARDVSALGPNDVDTQLANSTNPVQNKVLYGLLGTMPSDFFSGDALASAVTGTTLRIQNALGLDDMKIYGDTFQQTYSGKNLFNKDSAPQGGYLAAYSALSTGVRATATSTVNYTYLRYVMNVENYVGQTLTLSATASASASNMPALAMGTCDSAGNNRVPKATQTGTGELTVSYTIASGDQYIYLNFYANQVSTAQVGDYADYKNAQLEIGSAPTDYQPFVGGTASPNPDYPQNIDVVTGVQTVTVKSKNLIDNTDLAYDYTNANLGDITLTSTTTGISMTYTGGGNAPFVLFVLQNLSGYEGKTIRMSSTFNGDLIRIYTSNADGTSRNLEAQTSTSGEVISWTVPNDLGDRPYLAYVLRGGSAGTYTFNDLIMTVDNGDMTYQPYQSQSYTVDLGSIELCKIGNYQDYIYKSGGDWYMHKEIRKRTLVGTETWTADMVSSNRFFGFYTGDGVFNNTSGNIVFSDKFYNRFGSDNNSIMLSANASTPGRMLVFINGIATNTTDWKTWLSNNNTLVYYPLATPTDTQITDQTLIDGLNSALNMTCYDGETNVVVTSTNLAGALELVAVNANAKGLIYKARQ